jgi:hypothetical protein
MEAYLVTFRDSFGDQEDAESIREQFGIVPTIEEAKIFASSIADESRTYNNETLLSPSTVKYLLKEEEIQVHQHYQSDDGPYEWNMMFLCVKINIPFMIHPNIEKYCRNLKQSSGLSRMLIEHFDERGFHHKEDDIDHLFKTEFGPMMWWVSMFIQYISSNSIGALSDTEELLIARLFGLIEEEKNKEAHDLILEYLQKNSAF